MSAPTLERLPACIENWSCQAARYNTVFHRGHAPHCPRHIPNAESFCVDCGTPIHYRPHAGWCPRAGAVPTTSDRDALIARSLRDEFCDCDGHGLPDDQHAPDGCHGLEVAASFWRVAPLTAPHSTPATRGRRDE